MVALDVHIYVHLIGKWYRNVLVYKRSKIVLNLKWFANIEFTNSVRQALFFFQQFFFFFFISFPLVFSICSLYVASSFLHIWQGSTPLATLFTFTQYEESARLWIEKKIMCTYVNLYLIDRICNLSMAGFFETIKFVVIFVPLNCVQFFVVVQIVLTLELRWSIPINELGYYEFG